MRNRLRGGAAPFGDISGCDPMGKGSAEIPGFLVVIGQQFRLGRADEAIFELLQRTGDALMEHLAPALQ